MKKKELNELEVEEKHVKKNIGKCIKVILIIALFITVGGVLYSVTGGSINNSTKGVKVDHTSKVWPNNDYTKGLTKPSFGDIEVETLVDTTQTIKIVNCNTDNVLNYINSLTYNKISLVNTDTFIKYVGTNENYKLTIQFDGNKMIIYIEQIKVLTND